MSKINTIIRRIKVAISNNEQYIGLLRSDGVKIGNNCLIHKLAVFGTEPYLITIGDKVRITRGVKLITHDGGLWVPRNLGLIDKNADKFGKVVIGNNVNIGWDAIIMPGVTIGDNCIIGAGAVVTKNIPSNSVAAGVPARVIESIEEYAKKNSDKVLLTKNLPSNQKKIQLRARCNKEGNSSECFDN